MNFMQFGGGVVTIELGVLLDVCGFVIDAWGFMVDARGFVVDVCDNLANFVFDEDV